LRLDEDQAILRMIDDVAELILAHARIEGVTDASDSDDAVPTLQVPRGVRSKCRNTVTLPYTPGEQRRGNLACVRRDRSVIGALDGAVDAT
jgi:hypothetical protein